MGKYSMYGMAGVGIAAAIGFVFALGSLGGIVPNPEGASPPIGGLGGPGIFQNETGGATVFSLASTQTLKKFSTIDELKGFLAGIEANRGQLLTGMEEIRGGLPSVDFARDSLSAVVTDGDSAAESSAPQSPPAYSKPSSAGGTDFSTTNVQVRGVDEPDFLKNDGKYAYILSGDRLTIIDAYPAEDAEVVLKIGLDIQQGQYLQNMFLNNNTLVIFYQEYGEHYVIQEYDFAPSPVYLTKTHALVLDVTDRENASVKADYEVDGSYSNSRMIGDYVYLVTASDLYDYRNPIIPKVMESSRVVASPDIYYFDNPEAYYSFNTVTSIDLTGESRDPVNSQTYMMNPASTLYVSEDNIYIAYEKHQPYHYYSTNSRERFFEVIVPLLPEDVQAEIREIQNDDSTSPSEKWDRVSVLLQDTYNSMPEGEKERLFDKIRKALSEYDARIARETQKTVVHKIAIERAGGLEYVARGEVPGRLLNQFSMDESGDRFRVATTSEFYLPYEGRSVLHNNVYVLDEEMERAGALEEIAPGESIYAARFMGDRLYLVTFERIDPFFVIDLSTDRPKVLGELKLPGYSNYLHPYDGNHVIGIGRETKETQWGGVEILGVKLALFDVSDVNNPRVVDVYEIGGRNADSEVLQSHKALLFDREKNVLSIPVSMYPDYAEERFEGGRIIQPKPWYGFYVFGVDPQDGFELRGKVDHSSSPKADGDEAYYPYYYGSSGSRSFYIDDVLYTVTLNNLIKMNDLADRDLDEINELSLGSRGGIIPYPALEDGAVAEGGGAAEGESPPSQPQ